MATGQTREMRRGSLKPPEQIIWNVFGASGNDRLPRWWWYVPQQPKPHCKFPPSPPSSATTLQPPCPPDPVLTRFHVTCSHIPLVATTKCPLRCFLQVDVLAQLIVRARGVQDQSRPLHYPPQLLNGSQSFRSVPNFPAGYQSSQILPARSIILSSNSMPQIYANLVLLYHTSGMPSLFAAPCAFPFAFCSEGVDT